MTVCPGAITISGTLKVTFFDLDTIRTMMRDHIAETERRRAFLEKVSGLAVVVWDNDEGWEQFDFRGTA